MTRLALGLLILILWAFPAFSQNFAEPFIKSSHNRYPNMPSMVSKSAFIEEQSYQTWDLTHNLIELHINPAVNYIRGEVTFTIKSKTDGLAAVSIDLSDELTVHTIKSHKQNLAFTHQNEIIKIDFDKPLLRNNTASFTVSYEGAPTSTGFGAFSQSFHGDNIPVIYTLSEPYGAKEWWPCKQSLVDKIDSIDIIVHSPEPYQTASNGLLLSNIIEKGTRTCHWKHRHPIAAYLVFVSTTEYEVYSDWATLSSGSRVEIVNYVYPSSLDYAQQQTPFTADLLKLYSDLFIDYPFKNEKYGHAQFSWGGGMEHQTMSSMGGFSHELIAHELAHQWFGDYITCGSWSEIWLNEGFATYVTGMYYENLNADPWWTHWREMALKRIMALPGGSVYVSDTSDIDRIFDGRLSYNKAAYVLHMLRGQLGDEVFFEGVRNYLTDPRVVNGFATTDLLRENIELAADSSLIEFFNDWIYGEGYPTYQIDCFVTGSELLVEISQTPSVPDGPFFEMKIPISLYKNGERSIHWIQNLSNNESHELHLGYSPDSVIVDEDYWLLGKINSTLSSSPYISTNELKIYFNNNEGFIFLDAPGVDSAIIELYNVSGKLLMWDNWDKQHKKISAIAYRPGIYVLLLKSKQNVYSSKIIIK